MLASILALGLYFDSSTPAAHLYVSTRRLCAPMGSRLSAPSASCRAMSLRYSARSLRDCSNCSDTWGWALRQRQIVVYRGMPSSLQMFVSDPPSDIFWHTKSTRTWLKGSARVLAKSPRSRPFCTKMVSPVGSTYGTIGGACSRVGYGFRCTESTAPVRMSMVSMSPVFGFRSEKTFSCIRQSEWRGEGNCKDYVNFAVLSLGLQYVCQRACVGTPG